MRKECSNSCREVQSGASITLLFFASFLGEYLPKNEKSGIEILVLLL